jgi:hypothetical protein
MRLQLEDGGRDRALCIVKIRLSWDASCVFSMRAQLSHKVSQAPSR